MTLELTPEQLHDLRTAVKISVENAHSAGRGLWDATAAAKERWAANTRRIEDLADLLRTATSVSIHQP